MVSEEQVLWSDKKRWGFLGLPWTFTTYTLSQDRLFIQRGFLNQVEDEVRLYRIMDLKLTKTLFQRMFGLGTIHCDSADRSMGEFQIINIRNADEVKELLSVQVEQQRTQNRVYTREAVNGFDEMDDETEE